MRSANGAGEAADTGGGTAHAPEGSTGGGLPTASLPDTAGVVSRVLFPVLAGGVITRRPAAMSLAERRGWDRGGIECVRDLRRRHGPGPLRITVRGRSVVLVMEPEDAQRLLSHTPDPFTPATMEKRGALAQFQPHGVLVSDGERRERRRGFVADVLEADRPVHQLAGQLTSTVREEARRLLDQCAVTGGLDWEEFSATWWATVRRIVLGDAARDDNRVTAQLDRLRSAANWSVPTPRRAQLRTAFLQRVRAYTERAEPGSLAARTAAVATAPGEDASGQIPHWLFAFDAAGMATVRALALLASHPDQAARAREEATAGSPESPRQLPLLRGCALESVRLWPTTPLILRESTAQTVWRGHTLPAHTTFALYTPYLHRAEPAAPYGDSFAPDIWSTGEARSMPGLLPFSAGAAACPGRNLVLFTVSTMLAALLERHSYALVSHPDLQPTSPVPAGLDPFKLRFRVCEE